MRKFAVLHIVVPLLIGLAIYGAVDADILVFRFFPLTEWDGGGDMPSVREEASVGLRLVRNYMPDILWAYALAHCIYWVIGEGCTSRWGVFVIAAIFSILMESLQYGNVIRGTFDVWDVIWELAAEWLAVFVISKRRKL